MRKYSLLIAITICACTPSPAPEPPKPEVTGPSLSLLEPAEGGCAWKRLDPRSGEARVIKTFAHGCHGANLSWSADGKRALVVFNPQHLDGPSFGMRGVPKGMVQSETAPAGTSSHRYLVELATKNHRELPAPPHGALDTLGFAGDQVIALTSERVAAIKDDGGAYLPFGEKKLRIDTEADGIPILVHASEWKAESWQVIETKVSDSGWDLAQGVDTLAAKRELSPDAAAMLTAHPSGDAVEDPALLGRLAKFAPAGLTADDYQWLRLAKTTPAIYVWQVNIEFVWATGVVVFEKNGQLSAAPGIGFTAGDITAPLLRDGLLLVTSARTGTHPRLYDTAAGALIYSSDTARAAVFWP